MLRNLKIQTRLLLVSSVIMLLGVGILLWSVLIITDMDALSQEMTSVDRESDEALEAGNILIRMSLADISYLLSGGDLRYYDEHVAHRAQIGRYVQEATLRNQGYDPNLSILAGVETELAITDANWDAIHAALLEDDPEAAIEPAVDNADRLDALSLQTDEIYYDAQASLVEVKDESESTSTLAWTLGGGALFVFGVAAVLAAITVTRQVMRPLMSLIDAANAMARGEFDPGMLAGLTGRKDEIGRVARSFVEMAAQREARRAALAAEGADLRAKLAKQGVEVAPVEPPAQAELEHA